MVEANETQVANIVTVPNQLMIIDPNAAKLKITDSNKITMKREHATPAVAIKKTTEHLNEFMIPMVPQLKIGDNEQTSKCQSMFNKLIAFNNDFQTLYTKIDANTKSSAQIANNLLAAYGKFVNTEANKVFWNDSITKVDRTSLKKLLDQGPDLKDQGEKFQKEIAKVLAEVQDLITEVGYEGADVVDKYERKIKKQNKQLKKICDQKALMLEENLKLELALGEAYSD